MVGLIVAMLGGVEVAVVAMLAGVTPGASLWLAVRAADRSAAARRRDRPRVERNQARLAARFPAAGRRNAEP